MNVKPCIYDSHLSFRTTQEVKDLFLKAQKADKKRLNDALIKVCKYILDNPANNNTSTNVKEEKPAIVAEKVQVAEEKEVKPVIVTTTTTTPTINKKSAKEPTKEELDELVREIQDDDKDEKIVSLREKRNSIKSSSELPVAFQNREEYFRYLNNLRLKYNVSIPAEKELYLAKKAEADEILIIDENSEDEE